MENKTIEMVNIQEECHINVIYVKYGSPNAAWERLGVYYPDELHFTGMELMGLTRQEALDLMKARDTAYLRS